MSHFVNQLVSGGFQAPRKPTDRLYEMRTPEEGVPLAAARVFNAPGPAKNSLNAAGLDGTTREVTLMVEDVI